MLFKFSLLALYQEHPSLVKRLILLIILLIFTFQLWGKRYLYQHLYGTKSNAYSSISNQEIYQDLPSDYSQKTKIHGHEVNLKLLKRYQVTARVVYVDRYKGWFGKMYRASGNKAVYIYDDVVPQDVSLLIGSYGDEDVYQSYDFSHEYRCLWSPSTIPNTQTTNIHTIAATPKIQKGLDILKYGDIATIEGYLLHWEAYIPEEMRMIDFTSATFAGEISKQRAGGRKTGLCKQLYLTKLTFDGYTFE